MPIQTIIPPSVVMLIRAILKAKKEKKQLFVSKSRNTGITMAYRIAMNDN